MATTLKIRTKGRTLGVLFLSVAATLVAGFAIPYVFADDSGKVEARDRITLEDVPAPNTPDLGGSIQPVDPSRERDDADEVLR